MIVTEKFVFIHLHKTGGQFINRLLLNHFEDARQIGYHHPLSLLPPEYNNLPMLAFVRNPWDWYVSWYAFNVEFPERNPIYVVLSQKGRYGFKQTICNMLRLGEAIEPYCSLKDELLEALPDTIIGNTLSGLTRNCLTTFDDGSIGYYTWLVRRMIGVDHQAPMPMIGKTETLREDLLSFLHKVGYQATDAMLSYINDAEKMNQSTRGGYQEYYDSELKDLVASKECSVIDKYGYVF